LSKAIDWPVAEARWSPPKDGEQLRRTDKRQTAATYSKGQFKPMGTTMGDEIGKVEPKPDARVLK
jgi:hypothetical protein